MEGKITIFKAIFKIMHLSLVTNIPTEVVKKLSKMQKELIWNGNTPLYVINMAMAAEKFGYFI